MEEEGIDQKAFKAMEKIPCKMALHFDPALPLWVAAAMKELARGLRALNSSQHIFTLWTIYHAEKKT